MTLENAQNFRDKYTSEISNISASNDPRRIRTDNNERLIINATVIAAGDVLNLSEDQLNAAITDRDSLYKVLDAADIVRRTEQGIQHRGEVMDRNPDKERGGYIDNVDEVADVFGREQDEFFVGERQFNPKAKSVTKFTEGRDPSTGERRLIKRGEGSSGGWRDLSVEREGRFADNRIGWQDMTERELDIKDERNSDRDSGLPGVKDALKDLRRGTDKYGHAAFPGSAQVEGRLEDSLEYGPTQRAAEQSLVREIVARDNRSFNPEIKAANDRRAAAEASILGERYASPVYGPKGEILRGGGAIADEALRREKDVQDIGQVKTKERITFAPTVDTSNFGSAEWQGIPGADITSGYYVDSKTGEIVDWTEPEVVPPAQVNVPTSDQALNAPVTREAADWMKTGGPEYATQGGLNFGDYPQVNISGVTGDFSNRLRILGRQTDKKTGEILYPELAAYRGNVRTADEVVEAANYIINQKLGRGGRFYSQEKDPVTGRKRVIESPGISDVLNMMRMSSGDEEALKNALFQIERSQPGSAPKPTKINAAELLVESGDQLSDIARRNNITEDELKVALQELDQGTSRAAPGREEYQAREAPVTRLRVDSPQVNAGVSFSSPEAVDPSKGAVEVAKVPYYTRGQTGRTVRSIFKEAESLDAVKPFIGATAEQGEADIPRKRAKGMDPTEVRWQQESMGRQNQGLASNERPQFTPEEVEKIRGYQLNNLALTEQVKKEMRARGENVDFLTHNPKGRQSRPLPQHINTSPALGIDPRSVDMTQGFDFDAWSARQAPAQQAAPPKGTADIANEAMARLNERVAQKQAETTAATPPPPRKPPTRTATAAPTPGPWHRGKKRYIAGGAAGLGSIGLVANELNRRKEEEEQMRYGR